MNTNSYADVNFADEAAWLDFLRSHDDDHSTYVDAALDASLVVTRYMLGDADERDAWMERHQRAHEDIAQAYATDEPPNLEDWELDDEEQFRIWTLLHQQEHERMDAVIGL